MSLITWQLLTEQQGLHQQIHGLLEDLKQPKSPWELLPQTVETPWMPAIELQETGTALILQAHLPDLAPDQLDIQVSENAVFLSGNYPMAPPQPQEIIRSEFHYGQFRRVLPLPVRIQQASVIATLVNGLLTIQMPKRLPSIPSIVKVPVLLSNDAEVLPQQVDACRV